MLLYPQERRQTNLGEEEENKSKILPRPGRSELFYPPAEHFQMKKCESLLLMH